MTTLLRLCLSFFKIGLFTFGGGLSMFPMLEREVITRRGWCTREEILDYYAVGQCTPGVIAVDVAAFIGYRQKKTLGAIVAPLCVVLPGVLLVLLMATLLQQVADVPAVRSAFAGIRVAVCALITVSLVNILRESVKRWWQLGVALASFAVVAVLGQNPAWVVLGAGLGGLFGSFGSFGKKKEK
ncbi:MAG: chromate transporter [Oscillospiraceae bacterium]|nr:chromate transporter [Oscillospiraceae bacterium]